ncbi:MAG: PKD domain-containing protein [Bacteroidota bacterium]
MKRDYLWTSRVSWMILLMLTAYSAQAQVSVDINPDTAYYCTGTPAIPLTGLVTGGTPPYTVQWSPAAGLDSLDQLTTHASPTVTTFYTIAVTDALLNTGIDSVLVIVNDPILVSIDSVDDQCLAGNGFSFSFQTSSAFTNISWDFGLSATPATSQDSLPTGVVFATPGSKTIFLQIANGGCLSDTVTTTFTVQEVIAGAIGPAQACANELVDFQDVSLGIPNGVTTWNWLFSDGQSATTPSFSRTFATPGTYTYELLATDDLGCADSAVGNIVIEPDLIAAFTDSVDGCYEAHFFNQSSLGPGGIYQWTFGDGNSSTQFEPTHTYTSVGTYEVRLFAFGNCGPDTLAQTIVIGPECVWPGDANNDGIANNQDVLALGLGFGFTGPPRFGASLNWEGQPTDSWSDSLSIGINAAYADTDGDADVDSDDTLAISLNYGLTHNKTSQTSGSGLSMYFDTTSIVGPIVVGSPLSLPIMLGTASLPVDSIHGIAFTVNYQSHLVDTNTMNVQATSGWFGTDLLQLRKDFYLDGLIDVGLSKKDQINSNGSGQIAAATFVMIDDIAKRPVTDTLRLTFSDIYAITASGAEVAVSGIPANIVVVENKVSSQEEAWMRQLSVFPNPSRNHFRLSSEGIRITSCAVLDVQGKLVWESSPAAMTEVQIPAETWSSGMYLLRVQTSEGTWTHKLEKQ